MIIAVKLSDYITQRKNFYGRKKKTDQNMNENIHLIAF